MKDISFIELIMENTKENSINTGYESIAVDSLSSPREEKKKENMPNTERSHLSTTFPHLKKAHWHLLNYKSQKRKLPVCVKQSHSSLWYYTIGVYEF